MVFSFFSRELTKSSNLDKFMLLEITSWLISFVFKPKAILFLIVSSNKYISCGTYPICFCQSLKLPSRFTSSTNMLPWVGFIRPKIRSIKVLFPAPDFPIIPIFCPCLISKQIFWSIFALEFSCKKNTFSNFIWFLKKNFL